MEHAAQALRVAVVETVEVLVQQRHDRRPRVVDVGHRALSGQASRPSARIASCTAGRWPTRRTKACRLSRSPRSSWTNLAHAVTTNRYASAAVKASPVKYEPPASCVSTH